MVQKVQSGAQQFSSKSVFKIRRILLKSACFFVGMSDELSLGGNPSLVWSVMRRVSAL